MLLHSATQAGLESDGDLGEQEFKDIVRQKTDEQLNNKLKLGDFFCNALRGDPDPRTEATINRMRRQQQWINDMIAERKRAIRAANDEPEPEPVTVQLSTLKVNSKMKGVNDGRQEI